MSARSHVLFHGQLVGTTAGQYTVYTCPSGFVVLVKWVTWYQYSGTTGTLGLFHLKSTGSPAATYWIPDTTTVSGSGGGKTALVYGCMEAGDTLVAETATFAREKCRMGIYGARLDV